jgi:hypothetical protein
MFWQEFVRKKFFDPFFLMAGNNFLPLKWYTDRNFFGDGGGGRRAILADTPPPIKRG